jgi:hypothetical protein
MSEVWKKVVGYSDYAVSNNGVVKSLKYGKEKVLKLDINKDGYYIATLSRNGKKKRFRVNRLVAELFIPNPDNLPVVNHKDGNKKNNSVNNLEWSTVAENTQHAYDTGLISKERHRKGRQKLMKPLLQIDKNTGEVVRRFESYREAVKELNMNAGNLSTAIKNGWVCKGFKWKYE